MVGWPACNRLSEALTAITVTCDWKLGVLMLKPEESPGQRGPMKDNNSHMPFLMVAPTGERVLFFCQAERRDSVFLWKLFVQYGIEEPFRLQTGLSESTIECSPTAWYDDTGWHVSFVAGGDPVHPAYHLYRMDGVSLQHLSPPVAMKLTRTGFIDHRRIVSGDKLGNVHISSPESDFVLEFPRMELLRLSYKADMPHILLVTCRWPEEDTACTVAYDLETADQQFVEADGESVYKPAWFRDEMLHAVRLSQEFEDRRIVAANQVVFIPCQMASVRPVADQPIMLPDIEKTDRSRLSDLLGVEKHLGAAFALSSEILGGHAYRMRFVGHLHEAEEECQGHPSLGLLIRQFRKAYQTNRTIPDWNRLANALYKVMDESQAITMNEK